LLHWRATLLERLRSWRQPTPRHSSLLFPPTATTHIYTLSLHDALPILFELRRRKDADELRMLRRANDANRAMYERARQIAEPGRSEEHTSELQSRGHLVCRLLLEKKKSHGRKH